MPFRGIRVVAVFRRVDPRMCSPESENRGGFHRIAEKPLSFSTTYGFHNNMNAFFQCRFRPPSLPETFSGLRGQELGDGPFRTLTILFRSGFGESALGLHSRKKLNLMPFPNLFPVYRTGKRNCQGRSLTVCLRRGIPSRKNTTNVTFSLERLRPNPLRIVRRGRRRTRWKQNLPGFLHPQFP